MAVTFTSYGYDTLPGEGLGELVWQEMFPQIGSATYAVRSAGDWKVTAVSGADRTVSIAAGRGLGMGIIDKTVENDTIQLDPVAGPAGTTRWDLIVCRRDPTPSAGVSKFIGIVGGANPVIPGARLSGPGIHDQPLALVPVIAGQTQPGTIIDLRTWVGDGGGLVANHDLVRSFLNAVGTRLNINGVDWIRRLGLNDTPEWFAPDEPTVYAPVGVTNLWAATGAVTSEPAGSKRRITVDATVKRLGAAFTLDSDEWEFICPVIPAAVQSTASGVKYLSVVITGGGNHITAAATLNPGGSVTIRSTSGSYPFTTGAQFTINTSYYI